MGWFKKGSRPCAGRSPDRGGTPPARRRPDYQRLQRHGQVIHVLVGRLEDLSGRLAELGPQSRDFC